MKHQQPTDYGLTSVDRAIARFIECGALTTLLARLVQCPSETGHERQVAFAIAEFLGSHGLPVEVIEVAPHRPNVISRCGPANSPSLLLTGHTDTVPIGVGWSRDPLAAEVVDGRMYGRGAADMKGGLAAMLIAMAALQECQIASNGCVVFAGCIDEELSGIGTRALIDSGLRANCAVIGEPTDLQPICSAKGNCYLSVSVRGRAAHAGSPHLGINAIYGAADLIHAIDRHNETLRRFDHPLLGAPSISVGRVRGGEGVSSVPALCEFEVDRRLLPGETRSSVLADLQDVLRRGAQQDHRYAYDASLVMELPALETPREHPLVAALAEAAVDAGASPQSVGGWNASCDGGLLQNANIPTLLFGPGSVERHAHRPDEFVLLRDVEIAARTYGRLCARYVSDPSAFEHNRRE